MGDSSDSVRVAYHLCPQCFRATPEAARERFCPNDGSAMLQCCPRCAAGIPSPYDRFCRSCGQDFGGPPGASPEVDP